MTRNDLNLVPVPEETRTYKPISTNLIFQTIDQLADKNNLYIKQELFDVKQKGQMQRMRFIFDTNHPKFAFEIAIMNSYNKTISLRVGSGSSAAICWNLQVMAPFKIQEKHMSDVREDLLEFLTDSFKIQQEQIQNAQTLWSALDYVTLSKKEISQLAGRMFFEEKLIGADQAMILCRELEKPSFNYDYNPESLNSLYQHTTFAIQNEHPTTFLQTQQGVQSFFVDTYEEITNNKLILI